VPYQTAVEITLMEPKKDNPKILHIQADIIVSSPGQKAMVIGKGGEKVKAIGTAARKELKEVFDTKIMIQLYYLPLLQKLSEDNPKYERMIQTIGTSERDNGLISSSMSKIGPALGLDMTMYHDALSDVRITMKMFSSIVSFMKTHKNVDISKYQIERIKTYR